MPDGPTGVPNLTTGVPFPFRTVPPIEVPQYANGVAIALSQWDVVIEFQHQTVVGQTEDGPQVGTKTVDRIVMSPQHARAFYAALGEAMDKWQKTFGRLKDLRGVEAPKE